MIEQLLADLRRDEGEVLHAYQDSLGYWTIGVGRLIDKRLGGGITSAESKFLLLNDVAKVIQGLDRELPWWRTLSESRQRVLANLCFQLGLSGLLKFHTMLGALKVGDYRLAAERLRKSLLYQQTTARAERHAKVLEGG